MLVSCLLLLQNSEHQINVYNRVIEKREKISLWGFFLLVHMLSNECCPSVTPIVSDWAPLFFLEGNAFKGKDSSKIRNCISYCKDWVAF